MPKFDFDYITLGHGSGGLLTHRLLKSGVFDVLSNEWLDKQHDGAMLELNGRVAFSSDSYVITPAFFPGGNIGELAVNGTVNDLSMCGAIPQYLSLSFIIEEGLSMQEFWEVLVGVKRAAEASGIKIVTGDTKVVERGKGDKIFVNTSGVGRIHARAQIDHARIEIGDKILVSGNIATHGVAIMSVRKGLEFETTIKSDTTNLNHIVHKLLDEFGTEIKFMRDPTRGGVASVLNEIAEQTGMGYSLEQSSLPMDEQVEGACEMLGLDPLYVANEGIFLLVVSPSVAEAVLSRLREESTCRQAANIGEVTEDHPGKVVMKSSIGGRRVVNYLTGEQLPRIC